MTVSKLNSRIAAGLEGKICVVTGGTRGIGFAIAQMLAEEGAQVVICGQRKESLDLALSQFETLVPNKVKGKVADVKHHGQVAALFDFVDAEFGGLDILVNSAGIGEFSKVSAMSAELWDRTVGTNLTGAFYCSQEALRSFERRGGGYIVNISSLAGKHSFAGGAAYNASKAGLNAFGEAMMLDVRYDNVRVTTVMPGSVATGFGKDVATGAEKDAPTGFGKGVVTEFGKNVATGAGKDAATGAGSSPTDGLDWKIWPEDIAEVVRLLVRMPARTLISQVEIRPALPKR